MKHPTKKSKVSQLVTERLLIMSIMNFQMTKFKFNAGLTDGCEKG